jgi:hypothetical protein
MSSKVLVTGGSGYLGTQWRPRPAETTIVETAESMRELGLLEER